ncbi:hypothetical protein DS745_20730 [Anaerobacillus alkaliphilus]|uniref:Uncharacterized protein n=1 Tax=Anaerobacillus alkaliphilus TaxID=1548597 RepID=A0A4Q0VKZ7_9BACI|nr:hypothetical protein [Anaerobacillus alkaliphilus]RXI96171.1 hypothetical protein DS745_20730 [Anaerobacillus alkaliphilus]
MTEKQFDRFEGMLTQLVSMVGHLKQDVEVIKADVAELKTDVAILKTDVEVLKADVADLKLDMANVKADVAELKSDMFNVKVEITDMRETQERQHNEVMGKLELLRIDQEITWAKTVENEREIERVKKQLQM